MGDDAEGLAAEVARLRAERDELAREAARLDRRVHGGRVRRVVVGALVVLSTLSFLAAVAGVWVNRNLLDTDVWVERVAPLASDPAVQAALAAEITDQVMAAIDTEALVAEALPERGQALAGPLTGAVRSFVAQVVDRVVASEGFRETWVRLNEQGHRAAVAVLRGEDPPSELVEVADGTVTVSIVPAIDAVLARLSQLEPEILGRQVTLPELSVDDLPADARERIGDALGVTLDEDFGVITVYDGDALSTSQRVLRAFDRLLVASILLTLVLVPTALLVSRRRRRTALQLLVGAALVLVLLRRLALRLVSDVVDLAQVPTNAEAMRAILDAFVDPLLDATGWMLGGLAVVAAVLLLTGPYRWARALRRGTVRLSRTAVSAPGDVARDERVTAAVGRHLVALQVAGGAVVLAGLWWWDLSWLGVLVLLALVGAVELALARLADEGGPGGDIEPDATPDAAAGP